MKTNPYFPEFAHAELKKFISDLNECWRRYQYIYDLVSVAKKENNAQLKTYRTKKQ